jgi:hypothetical protein
MKTRSTLLAFGAFTLASLVALPVAMRSAEAAPPKGNPFPPINSCGTIDGIPYQDLEGNTVICYVWHSDKGGTYRFDGIESYMIGERVHVQGQACTICTPFCGGAVPILNANDSPCN